MFNPRSFRVILLYYYMDLFILISLHVWIPWVVTDIWWKFPINSPIKNIFTEKKNIYWKKKEKNVDMFNTYFHYMLHLMPKLGQHSGGVVALMDG